MSPQIKLALRRFTLRWLRKLVDVADDRLHAAEVMLRNDLSQMRAPEDVSQYDPTSVRSVHTTPAVPSAGESFTEWEARRSGLTPKVKTHRRRRVRSSAADFDFQIIRKREEFVQ
jgi:hypothetical protein